MSAISLEFGITKVVLLIFSILFLFFAIYPFIIQYYPPAKGINADYRNYILIILAAVQTIYILRMKRPRVV